jgi:transcriptional regulator with XRE-family HTH domain
VKSIPYSGVLARNIRAARSRLGIHQDVLAGRMRSLGFPAWLRQTVAKVEQGQRRVNADEVFGLAYALETSMSALMRATGDDDLVSFPGGTEISGPSVLSSALGRNDGAIEWHGTDPVVSESDLKMQAMGQEAVDLFRAVRSRIADERDAASGSLTLEPRWHEES